MNILRATKLKYGAIHSAEPKQMWGTNSEVKNTSYTYYYHKALNQSDQFLKKKILDTKIRLVGQEFLTKICLKK